MDREETGMKGKIEVLVMGTGEDTAQRPRVMGGLL